ncbi:hypothetical protein RA241_003725 [Cronobacter sakazakii]|nr:hypothetical protein [Cronobacter sakazakii]
MAVTAQNQSPAITTIPEVLEAGIPAVIQNIRAAQRRVTCDDLAARFFDNAVQSAEMLLAQAIDVHNGEVDNYNSLLDLYENVQLKLGLKEKEIEDLQLLIEQRERQKQDDIDEATHEAIQRADKAELMCVEMENKLNETATMLELRNQQVNTLNKSYKEVLKLDPFNLEKRYAKAKRERQDLRKQVADLNQQIKKQAKDLSEARVAYAKQKTETVRLAEETTKYGNLQKEMYGITQRRFTSKKEHPTLGPITFYPRLLAYGVSAPKQFNTERPYIVSKLDFAYQFCCDMGYALDIRINEWLMPNFQPIPIFEEYQPEGWIKFFHELICEEMEGRRPELVRRVEWAQELMLVDADLPLSDELIEDLASKGLHTLFDVVTRRHAQLVANYDMTPEDAKTLLDVCYARSDAWEKNNGGAIYVR